MFFLRVWCSFLTFWALTIVTHDCPQIATLAHAMRDTARPILFVHTHRDPQRDHVEREIESKDEASIRIHNRRHQKNERREYCHNHQYGLLLDEIVQRQNALHTHPHRHAAFPLADALISFEHNRNTFRRHRLLFAILVGDVLLVCEIRNQILLQLPQTATKHGQQRRHQRRVGQCEETRQRKKRWRNVDRAESKPKPLLPFHRQCVFRGDHNIQHSVGGA
mmetsp:Transcript_46472/g.77225  ORF Transcript_46472/g.77225 Transcript_46472/m.77225 type:complete len:221 (-) Transcript_46472:495-1157(-)